LSVIKELAPDEPFESFALSSSAASSEVLRELTATQRDSYDLFSRGSSLKDVADIRGLKPSTVLSHLCEAIKLGATLDIQRLGGSQLVRRRIEFVLASAPELNGGSVIRLTAIREAYFARFSHEEPSWDDVKLSVALLTAKYGVRDNCLQWDEQDRKRAATAIVEDDKFDKKENAIEVAKNETEATSTILKPINGSSSSTSDSCSSNNSHGSATKKRPMPEWMSSKDGKGKAAMNGMSSKEGKGKAVMNAKKLKKNSLFK